MATTEDVIILKVGTDEAVKSVGDLKNNIKELKKQLDGYKEATGEVDEQGKKVYKTIEGLAIGSDAYKNALADATILTGYRNSMIYLFVGTLMKLLATLPCAYALSRKNLKGRRFWNLFFLITMYFSGGLVPTYLLHSSIGWINTPWVLLIPGCVNVYYMILARSSFQEMPESLHDAAIIDGASEFYYFIKIVIPLSKAVIATVFLFSALGWWNSYMPFLIF